MTLKHQTHTSTPVAHCCPACVQCNAAPGQTCDRCTGQSQSSALAGVPAARSAAVHHSFLSLLPKPCLLASPLGCGDSSPRHLPGLTYVCVHACCVPSAYLCHPSPLSTQLPHASGKLVPVAAKPSCLACHAAARCSGSWHALLCHANTVSHCPACVLMSGWLSAVRRRDAKSAPASGVHAQLTCPCDLQRIVDKRPRIKGRFVKPEELAAYLGQHQSEGTQQHSPAAQAPAAQAGSMDEVDPSPDNGSEDLF